MMAYFTLGEKITVAAIVVVGVIIAGICALAAVTDYNAMETCLAAGYPEYKWGGGTIYCIKRVNQSDVVVPLSQVR
jgi:hypothetical protein